MTDTKVNRNLILIGGKPASGKSASLRNIKNPEGVLFANCESGKELPFPSKFRNVTITDPYQVYGLFTKAEPSKTIHTIGIDTITMLMDMFESQNVITAAGDAKFKAWEKYGDYWRQLLQTYVASSSKNVIMLAHTSDVHNETESIMESLVQIKGSVMKQGVESYFCNVITARKMQLDDLAKYENKYLNITEDDEILGYKHVFQTRLTKDTVNERIRGPIGLWNQQETYIDNDVQFVLDRLHEYYK